MIAKKYTIKDPNGIHARPAAALVKLCRNYQSEINIQKDKVPVSLNSVIGLMTMGAKTGDTVKLTIDGMDELAAAEAIDQFFKEELSKS